MLGLGSVVYHQKLFCPNWLTRCSFFVSHQLSVPCSLFLTAEPPSIRPMHNSFLIFDCTNEEAAQHARHKLEELGEANPSAWTKSSSTNSNERTTRPMPAAASNRDPADENPPKVRQIQRQPQKISQSEILRKALMKKVPLRRRAHRHQASGPPVFLRSRKAHLPSRIDRLPPKNPASRLALNHPQVYAASTKPTTASKSA